MTFLMIDENTNDPYYYIKYKYKKQIIRIKIPVSMYPIKDHDRVEFWIDLVIKNKNKNMDCYGKTTGKYGVSCLVRVKEILFEFMRQFEAREIEIPEWMRGIAHTRTRRYFIVVGWEDSRRHRVYRRLKKYGFTEFRDFFEKEMIRD